MKQFTDIQENFFMETPAAVSRKTGVLYINPNYFNKLSTACKNFVIAHEYGHLINNSSNEKKADDFALWKQIGLGNDSIDVLKSFYDALPFKTEEQIERGEKLLRTVFRNEFKNGNNSANTFLDIIETEPETLDGAGGRIAKKIGAFTNGLGKLIAVIPLQPYTGIIGGAVSAAGTGISAGGNLAAAAANAKEAYALLADEQREAYEKLLDDIKTGSLNQAVDAQIAANQTINAIDDSIEQHKKTKNKKRLVCILIILLLATGSIIIIKK